MKTLVSIRNALVKSENDRIFDIAHQIKKLHYIFAVGEMNSIFSI